MRLFIAPQQSSVVHIKAVLTSTNLWYDQPRFFRGLLIQWSAGRLFVTVLQTSVKFLNCAKKSYKSSSFEGYFDCFLFNHTVGFCNINVSCLSLIYRENFALPVMSLNFFVHFCATTVVSMPRLANFSPCNPLIFCFTPLFIRRASKKKKKNFFSDVHG